MLDVVVPGYHYAPIIGAAVCARKSIVATISEDRSVRIINYLERRLEMAEPQQEAMYSVDLHPSGLHLLLGSQDKLRLMNILMGSLRLAREYNIKRCPVVLQVQQRGQYFAAVQPPSTILIFNTYTSTEWVYRLAGHSKRVTDLCWSPNDSEDGAVYLFNIQAPKGSKGDLKRSADILTKGCQYECVAFAPAGDPIYAVGSDRTVRVRAHSHISRSHNFLGRRQAPPGRRGVGLFVINDFIVTRVKLRWAKGGGVGTVRSAPVSSPLTRQRQRLAVPAPGAPASWGVPLAGPDESLHGFPCGECRTAEAQQAVGDDCLNVPRRAACKAAHSVPPLLRQITNCQRVDHEERTDLDVCRLACSRHWLFAATNQGILRAHRILLSGNVLDMVIHNGPIRALALTFADVLVTGGQDGSLVVTDLLDETDQQPGLGRQPFSEEVLITRSEMEEKIQAKEDLEKKVLEAARKNEWTLQLKELDFKKARKAKAAQSEAALAEEDRAFSRAKEAFNIAKLEAEERHRALEEEQQARIEVAPTTTAPTTCLAIALALWPWLSADLSCAVQALRVDNGRRITERRQQLDELHQRKVRLAQEWSQRLQDQSQRNEDEFQQTDEGCKQAELHAAIELQKEREGLETDRKYMQELRLQMDQDQSRITDRLTANQEAMMSKLSQRIATLQTEITSAGREMKDLENAIRQLDLEEAAKARPHPHAMALARPLAPRTEIAELTKENDRLAKEKDRLAEEIHRKDLQIREEEERVHELKGKNQYLEKHKFVKDYRIKELKLNMKPRDDQIRDMKDTIALLDQTAELAQRLAAQQAHIRTVTRQAVLMEERAAHLERAIAQGLDHFQDPPAQGQPLAPHPAGSARGMPGTPAHGCWVVVVVLGAVWRCGGPVQGCMERLIADTQTTAEGSALEQDVANEYDRQRQFLEETRDALRRRLQEETRQHQADKMRIMQDNMKLIQQINELHRDIKDIKQKKKAGESHGPPKRSAPAPTLCTRAPASGGWCPVHACGGLDHACGGGWCPGHFGGRLVATGLTLRPGGVGPGGVGCGWCSRGPVPAEAAQLMERQREEIARLRERIAQLQIAPDRNCTIEF
ncbi:putative cilia- and flagella-associated protein 57 [Paratrimastix pyriformis]|uniref:Cilia- and flagella-associated protein 57 n=1 Tax=Paratrimastix pyriformis TaxID=342808 RepID=A0ABQ8UFZ9_9EUKA|nr:putative cilia- and flagella-associated protein 57 [Paratrimastix pyriformis]